MAELKKVVEDNFTRYAGNVILDRAICDVRDMLKPAARMLTYSQVKITKNTADKPFIKSARVVGDCLGHYYTHGDSSCYGTYMRMAKPFAMRYPLEDCQGNSGTITASGDEAASRYTELRLSKIGNLLFNDIDKDTIDDWYDNFDETEQYPKVLPSKGFYNIVNGTTGIGVSLSSSIPQFNLKEINNGLIKLLWNNDADIDILPDFATGALLLNAKEVKESLKNGKGSACILRAVIDYNAKDHCFIVKEIPYGVYTNTITNQIQDLLEREPNCGIEGINDGSGKTPDYLIYINKTASPSKVLDLLYAETSLQTHYTINMTVLKDGRTPVVMGLKEMLLEHLKHEELIYRRGFEYDKKKIEHRLHIIEGLMICLANIDEVVYTIKNAESTNDAAAQLKKRFILDDEQVKAILDMKLSRLAHLEVEKLQKEQNDLTLKLSKIVEILSTPSLLKKEIEKGLREIAERFGDARRTKIQNIATIDDNNIATVPARDLIIILETDKTIKAIDPSNMKVSNRGTKGTSIGKNGIIDMINASTNKRILVFDTEGNVTTIDTNTVPIVNELTDKGAAINTLCDCGEPMKMICENEKEFIIFATKEGYVKKSLLSEYKGFNKKTAALRLKENDTIININFANKEDNILIVNQLGKILNYSVEDIKTSGRITYGAKGSALPINSFTIGCKGDHILTYTNEGKGKWTPFEELNINSKTSSGFVAADNTIGIVNLKNATKICFVGEKGKSIIISRDDISKHSIKSIGAKLYNGLIEKVVCLA